MGTGGGDGFSVDGAEDDDDDGVGEDEVGGGVVVIVLGDIAGEEVRGGRAEETVVMNLTISSLRRCHAVIVSKYSTNGFSPSPPPSFVAVGSAPSKTFTVYSLPLDRNSSNHKTTARIESVSCPSMAITAPRAA